MRRLFLFAVLLGIVLTGFSWFAPQTDAAGDKLIYLSFISRPAKAVSLTAFGIQPYDSNRIGNAVLLPSIQQLGITGVRFGNLSWRLLQESPGGTIDWSKAAGFEDGLRQMKSIGVMPQVIVADSPLWAVLPRNSDGRLSSCNALKDEAMDDFAAFMRAVVSRYSQPEFGVVYYELGNEVDVDPDLVGLNNGFGCWGEISDPYYGGGRYGRMLKQVYPAIKAANPNAQVIFGGLLLDTPNTTDPNKGKPENFLEGALREGAGPYFDILAFHSYPPYLNRQIDYDTGVAASPWTVRGGLIRGKISYLRDVLGRYGQADKRLWLNETSLMCPSDNLVTYPWCANPPSSFFEAQADFLVRAGVRAISQRIEHITWYAMEDGWRYTGLLDDQLNPKTVFRAYQAMNSRLSDLTFQTAINYGSNIEAYRFTGNQQVDVVWSTDATPRTFEVPASQFVSAFTRDGSELTVSRSADKVTVSVGFSPIYLVVR